jgi:hypothetical protein
MPKKSLRPEINRYRLLQILSNLQRDQPLTSEDKQFLSAGIRAALLGKRNPFHLGGKGPNPEIVVRDRDMTRQVLALIRSGYDKDTAFEEVGKKYYRTGSEGGTVEKAYDRYCDEVFATDLLYRLDSEGRTPTPEELAELDKAQKRLFPKYQGKNSEHK